MANESRVFRLPAGMSTQVVANAVEAFLSSAKGMEVQSAETTEGYVVQGRQEKDGWKTIAGMRMATTVQMIRMDDNLNVTVGQGEWSDKIGAGVLGWFIAWPLAVTAGVGAYKQKKLPEEIFRVIEQCIVSGGSCETPGRSLPGARWSVPPVKPSVTPEPNSATIAERL